MRIPSEHGGCVACLLHEVGVVMVVFSVCGWGVLGFLTGMVGGGKECLA